MKKLQRKLINLTSAIVPCSVDSLVALIRPDDHNDYDDYDDDHNDDLNEYEDIQSPPPSWVAVICNPVTRVTGHRC